MEIISGLKKFKNFKAAKEWAKKNIVKIYSNEETGGKGCIEISNKSISKYFNDTSVSKSANAEIHKSVISVLPEIIKRSIVGEIHPDYIKKGRIRKPENGTVPNTEIHRLYGVVSLDGNVFRVKITIKYFTDNSSNNHVHTYEVIKIEALEKSNTSFRA